jgi:hypothetical protein
LLGLSRNKFGEEPAMEPVQLMVPTVWAEKTLVGFPTPFSHKAKGLCLWKTEIAGGIDMKHYLCRWAGGSSPSQRLWEESSLHGIYFCDCQTTPEAGSEKQGKDQYARFTKFVVVWLPQRKHTQGFPKTEASSKLVSGSCQIDYADIRL